MPEAGIIDYRQVCQVLAENIRGEVLTGTQVLRVDSSGAGISVETTTGTFRGDHLVNCTGLQCDRVCQLSGGDPELQIVPFKGEYFTVRETASHLCNHLIYPVPDPRFPFLGVHLTRMIHGGLEVGPNAILALGREAYAGSDLNLRDLFQTLSYPGFLRLAKKHWRMGFEEWKKSVSKRAFVRALNRLCPDLREQDLLPAPSGIRAQALHPDGRLEDDFRLLDTPRALHVLNAPSPAATSSLAIGQTIAERVLKGFELLEIQSG